MGKGGGSKESWRHISIRTWGPHRHKAVFKDIHSSCRAPRKLQKRLQEDGAGTSLRRSDSAVGFHKAQEMKDGFDKMMMKVWLVALACP